MKSLSNRKGGFTLIELMIVVAIIGILAAIAIPNFVRFQLRAKSSEGKVNLAAIRTAEEGYYSEFGSYVAATASPAAAPSGSAKAVWVNTDGAGLGFDQMGWAPEGQVYFNYEVVIGTTPTEYTAASTADLDADAVLQAWGYGRTVGGAAPGTSALGCTPPTDNQVVACDTVSGQSVF